MMSKEKTDSISRQFRQRAGLPERKSSKPADASKDPETLEQPELQPAKKTAAKKTTAKKTAAKKTTAKKTAAKKTTAKKGGK